jgi:RND family efflux transporter MFP subunit
VIEQNAEVGEVVGANTTLVSLISPSVFEIEAYVTETDIASISKGDTASVTLDAYGNDVVFSAEVVRIDPAETVIEGVATYRVVLIFEDAQGLARSGMTANVDIMTGVSENVLAVPARAVFTQNGVKHVRLQNADGSIETVTVTTGLRDSFGDIEIVSGITDGDQVVVFLEE